MSRSWLAWAAPLPRPFKITSGWDDRRGHGALDIPARTGTPVFSVSDGVVSFTVRGSESAGNMIGVEHEGHTLTRYLHLNSIAVKKGQPVAKGQMIGTAGNTGYSQIPHLHFDTTVKAEKLADYEAMFGRPRGGFIRRPYGWMVPSEPLIPADEYRDQVVRESAGRGVPLYASIVRRSPVAVGAGWGLAAVGLVALVGAGVFFVRSRA